MVRTVRLGWETRLDQLTLAATLAIAGIGLVLAGVTGVLGTVGGILAIIVGIILCLVDALRLLGWRSLLGPRLLTAGPDGVTDGSRMGRGFHIAWTDLTALGVYDDPAAADPRGLLVVLYPSDSADPDTFGPGVTWLSGPAAGTLVARLPRRSGVVAALRDAMPDTWRREDRAPWSLLLTGPGLAEAIPAPRPEPAVTVDVGRGLARQGVMGALVAAFFGVSAMYAAFGGGPEPTGYRITVALVGAPFLLVAVALVLSGPVVVRKRRIILDDTTFTWDDPTEESFTVAWDDLAAVSLEDHVIRNPRSGDRHAVRVVLEPDGAHFAEHHRGMARFARDGKYVIPLGDQPRVGQAVAAAAERLAPGTWRGMRTDVRRFGLT